MNLTAQPGVVPIEVVAPGLVHGGRISGEPGCLGRGQICYKFPLYCIYACHRQCRPSVEANDRKLFEVAEDDIIGIGRR